MKYWRLGIRRDREEKTHGELTSAAGALGPCSCTCLLRWWWLAYRIRWFGLRHSRSIYFLVGLLLTCWITFALLNIIINGSDWHQTIQIFIIYLHWIFPILFKKTDKSMIYQEEFFCFIYTMPLLFMTSFKINKIFLGQKKSMTKYHS